MADDHRRFVTSGLTEPEDCEVCDDAVLRIGREQAEKWATTLDLLAKSDERCTDPACPWCCPEPVDHEAIAKVVANNNREIFDALKPFDGPDDVEHG